MATPTSLPSTFSAGAVLTAAQMNDLRGAFRILQIVNATTTTQTASSSTTYISSTLTATITPRFTSSNILCLCTVSLYNDTAGGEIGLRLVRGSTTVLTNTQSKTGGASVQLTPFMHYDNPNTTSSTTYTLQFARTNGTGTVYTQVGSATSGMTLFEVSL